MKPLLNLDEPVQRRSGEPAEIIKRNARGDYPVVALISLQTGVSQKAEQFTLRGEPATGRSGDANYDLINVPKPPKVFEGVVYIGIDKYGNRQVLARHPSNLHHSFVAIKAFPYEITEGYGL